MEYLTLGEIRRLPSFRHNSPKHVGIPIKKISHSTGSKREKLSAVNVIAIIHAIEPAMLTSIQVDAQKLFDIKDRIARVHVITALARVVQSRPIVITTAYGHQIHFNSLKMTWTPLAEKKSIESGDTSISRHLKKYRALLNGAKNATPKPPFVIESNIPWEAIEANKKRQIGSRL